MSEEELLKEVQRSGKVTTAAGMCQAIWRQEAAEERKDFGRRWASGKGRMKVSDAIEARMSDYTQSGMPFEVAEMAEGVAAVLGEPDEDFMQGVREMCRKALRESPTELVGETIIPKYVTSQLPDGTWVRVPALNATYGDLLISLAAREDQMEKVQNALDKFRTFVEKVASFTPEKDDRVQDILAASLESRKP